MARHSEINSKLRRHRECEYPVTLYLSIYVVVVTIGTTKWWIYDDNYDGSSLWGIMRQLNASINMSYAIKIQRGYIIDIMTSAVWANLPINSWKRH